MLDYILLMAPQGGEGGKGDSTSMIIMMVLIIGVFYFFFIRPQTKKNKELKQFRDNLSKGDKVVTIGGIHGKILEIKDSQVIIEVEGQGRLKLEKSAVNTDGSAADQLQK